MSEPLRVDPAREGWDETGILVRAKLGETWVNADIAVLDTDSLNRFLRSRGGENAWAEGVVRIMLGHPPISTHEL